MEEKIRTMRTDFHDRVSMIDEDFSKSQEKLEVAIVDIRKFMHDAIYKKELKLEEEYHEHMNKMTNEIADNIVMLTDERQATLKQNEM